MTTAAMTRFEALCRDKCLEAHVSCLEAHVSILCLADMGRRPAGPRRIGSSAVALSEMFGRIAEALGAEAGPADWSAPWPASRHAPGTA